MNEKIVRHLRDDLGLDEADIPAIYDSFLGTLADCADKLRAAADPPDYAAIRAATHTIIGFSRNVGALDLGDAATALNAAAHAGDAAACQYGISEIRELCDQYRSEADSAGA